MITVIRERLIKNKSYKVLVWAIGIVLAVSLGLPGVMQQSSGSGTWVATVNGRQLEYNDYVRKVYEQEQHIRMFRQQYGQYAEALLQSMGVNADPQVLALDSFIREELLNQAAQLLSLHIHPDHIGEKLSDSSFVYNNLSDLVPFSAIDPTYGINVGQLRQHLQRTHLSMATFEEKVAQALERNLVKSLVVDGLYMPEFAIKDFYAREHAGKKFSVLTYSLSDFVRKEQQAGATEEQLKAFFDQHTNNYYSPEKRSGTVWRFDAHNYGVSVSNEEITTYYNDHKNKDFVAIPSKVEVRRILFSVAGKDAQEINNQAQSVRAELAKNPTLFVQMAQELSADKETAHKGGLLPAFARGTKDQALERAAFMLKEDGDISEVIQTKQGFEIVQRVSKTTQTLKSLAQVSSEISQKLTREKFAAAFTRDTERISDQNDGELLKQLASAKQAKAVTHAMVAQETGPVNKALFTAKTVGDMVFFMDGDAGVAVQLSGVQKRMLPALAAIKTTVQNDLFEQRATARLAAHLETMKKESARASLKDLNSKNEAKFEQTAMVHKSDAATLEALRAKGLPIEGMLTMDKAGATVAHVQGNNGYLIRLDELEPVDAAKASANRVTMIAALEQENGRMAMGGFVASLYRTATIKQNKSILNSQKEYSV